MRLDPNYLKQHYESLSDEALTHINRDDLTPEAQLCYDAEMAVRRSNQIFDPEQQDLPVEEMAAIIDPQASTINLDWLEDAAEVYSEVIQPGRIPELDSASARDALDAAHIPCHLEICEIEKEVPSRFPPPTHRWRLLVPGKLNMWASSVIQRDVFNDDFEAMWKGHLETLSDAELREMKPEVAFCGLIDRIERATRAYHRELAARKAR